MAPPIRQTHFVPNWIDMKPRIPVPKIDWIEKKALDIPYGPDPLQRYDLYYPEGEAAGPLPVVVIVHGGGFSHMDKRDWHLYPGFYALREGFALASVNYRLAPKAPFPAGLEDVEAAVGHIRDSAEERGLDGENIFLYGTSAGGNFVSILGLRDGGLPGVRGVASLCPLLDMDWFYAFSRELFRLSPSRLICNRMMRGYLGALPPKAGERSRLASATHYIGETMRPMYIQQGDEDPLIMPDHIRRFHRLLAPVAENCGAELVLDILEGAAHAGGGPDYLEERNILPILDFFRRQIAVEGEGQ